MGFGISQPGSDKLAEFFDNRDVAAAGNPCTGHDATNPALKPRGCYVIIDFNPII